jgi:hypothetical protein
MAVRPDKLKAAFMIRFLLRSIVSLICFALLLLALASLFFWQHSKTNIDVVRVAHPKVGYFDAAFNAGQAQLSFVRRADTTLKPAWLSKPINPAEHFLTPNPVIWWDFNRLEDRELPANMRHVKGNAEIMPTLNPADAPPAADIFAADSADSAAPAATASTLRWTHSLVLPGWLLSAGLAVLPVLWMLTGITRRALRRRPVETPAQDAENAQENPASSRRPHF